MLWRRRIVALTIMATMGCLVVIAISFKTVGAYSVQDTSQSQTGSTGATTINFSTLNFNSLLAPLQNFVNSITSIGNATPQLNLSTSQTQLLNTGARNIFQQFDTWLYGVAGFHISGLFVAILNVFSWALGLAQGAVNWLLGLVR